MQDVVLLRVKKLLSLALWSFNKLRASTKSGNQPVLTAPIVFEDTFHLEQHLFQPRQLKYVEIF